MREKTGSEARIHMDNSPEAQGRRPTLEVIEGGAQDITDVTDDAVLEDIDHEAIRQRANKGLETGASYKNLDSKALEAKINETKSEIEQQRAALQLGEQVLNSQSRETPPPIPGQNAKTAADAEPLSAAQLLDIQKQVLFHKERIRALESRLAELNEFAPQEETFEPLFTEADEQEAIEAQQKILQDRRQRQQEADQATQQQNDVARKEQSLTMEQIAAKLDTIIKDKIAQINADFGIQLKPNGQPTFGIRNIWRFKKMMKEPNVEFEGLYADLVRAHEEKNNTAQGHARVSSILEVDDVNHRHVTGGSYYSSSKYSVKK